MQVVVGNQSNSGPYRLAFALLYIAPCAVSLFASSALARQAQFSASGIWFIYEVSFFPGRVGVAIAGTMAVIEGLRRRLPAVFPWLLGIFVVVGILLLWYAGHIYQSLWAHRA